MGKDIKKSLHFYKTKTNKDSIEKLIIQNPLLFKKVQRVDKIIIIIHILNKAYNSSLVESLLITLSIMS